MSFDLTDKRVSDDDAFRDVTRLRAQVEKLRKENTALRKDRTDLLTEYEDLRNAKIPAKAHVKPAVKLVGDIVRVICGDLHGMLLDRPAVDAFLADLPSWNATEIVLLGDMVECGGWLAKHQAFGYVAQTNYNYQDDIVSANWFLDEIQRICPGAVIHYLEGNHEDRLERWAVDQTQAHSRDADFLRKLASPQTLLRLDERGIKFYRRSVVHGKGLPPGWVKLGKIFFVHELGRSANAARDSVSKAAGNVVFGHTHREDTATLVLPGVGLVKAFNPGCLCERQPLWKHSDPSNWSHGYAVEFINPSGLFLHHNIPILNGDSLVALVMNHLAPKKACGRKSR